MSSITFAAWQSWQNLCFRDARVELVALLWSCWCFSYLTITAYRPYCTHHQDYRGAIAHYTLAIEAAKSELEDADTDESVATETTSLLASYYGNRAAALTMILKYRDAIEDCDAALAIDPSFTKAYVRKAKLQMTLGDLDGAKKSFSLGMVRDPNDSAMLKQKEEVDTIKKRFGIASDMLEKVRSGKSSSFVRRDSTQALRQIEIVIAACPEMNEAGLIKVEALINLQRSEEAYALSTKLLRKGMSQNSTLLLLRARCLFNMGNLDDSLKHLRQILAGDPDNKPAFKLLKELRSLSKKKEEADTAYKSRNFEGARDCYSEALELCPADATAYKAKLHFNRGSANAALRNHEEVVKDCSSAIELDDEYVKAYMRRAASYLVQGGEAECESAIRDYEKASELAKTEEQERDINKKIRSAQVQLKRAKRKDFYKILGVSLDATDAEIKKACEYFRYIYDSPLFLHYLRRTYFSSSTNERNEYSSVSSKTSNRLSLRLCPFLRSETRP